MIVKQTSCADGQEDQLLSVADAQRLILDEIVPLREFEQLPLRDSLDRVLAKDLISAINVPTKTNSAVDGYAVSGDDLPHTGWRAYKMIGSALAGKSYTGRCCFGECVRVMTGAAMPTGTDTVIMQEHVEHRDGNITMDARHSSRQNVRQAGEDIAAGTKILSAGRWLTPADLGVIASLGIGEIKSIRRPKVAFFSTGDELRSIGDGYDRALAMGEVYDSNRYSLYALLRRLHVEIIDMGVIGDDEVGIKSMLTQAADMADIIITSGGVSVGEADYIKPVLQQTGKINFWKIAMKPGRPLTFGSINDSLFFGLPGNPVAVMVTFYQFVQPAITYLASGQCRALPSFKAVSKTSLHKRPGRFEFQRGVLSQSKDGNFIVEKIERQGSGILTSMSLGNCFILLDEAVAGIKAGESVTVQPFEHYFLSTGRG